MRPPRSLRPARGTLLPARVHLAAVLLAAVVGLASAPAAAEGPAPLLPRVDPAVAPLRGPLAHPAWTVRSLAAWELRNRGDDGVSLLITELLEKEKDPVVLDCALACLQARSRPEVVRDGGALLVDRVLPLGEHPHARVRSRARRVLALLAPVPLARSLEDYRGWWKRGRESHEREQQELLRQAPKPRPVTATPLAPGETASHAPLGSDAYEYLGNLGEDGLQVAIVMDSTGSMGPVIERAKREAVALLRRLSALVPRVQAGLVTYDDGAMRRGDLTHSETAWKKAFSKVHAFGGGDIEEGVDKGIRLASRQKEMGWSRKGRRVLVVIGDAPPHEGDVAPLLAFLRKAREDDLYDHPLVVHTVSTDVGGVEHFGEIADAGGGVAVTLADTSRLVPELVALAFGGPFQARVKPWLEEVELVRREDPI